MAAYDERAMHAPWLPHTQEWMARAALALAHCIVSGTAFLDLDAVVIDGVVAPALLRSLLAQTRDALKAYNIEGLQTLPRLEVGQHRFGRARTGWCAAATARFLCARSGHFPEGVSRP